MKWYKFLEEKRVGEKGSASGAAEAGPSHPGWCLPGQRRLWVSYQARVHISTWSTTLLNC